MQKWNTPLGCETCAICDPAKLSRRGRWFTASKRLAARRESGLERRVGRALKNNPLMRLSIHPPDYSHPAIWRQIVDLVSAMAPCPHRLRPIRIGSPNSGSGAVSKYI